MTWRTHDVFIYGNVLAPWALWICVKSGSRELQQFRLAMVVASFLIGAASSRPHYMHGAWTCVGAFVLGTIMGYYLMNPPKPPRNVRARARARVVSFAATVRRALPKRGRKAPVRKPVPA